MINHKPVLLLDMDGQLADFDQAFWDMCESRLFSFDIPSLEAPGRRRFLTDNMPDPVERRMAREYVNDGANRWFRDLPPVAGAIEGTYELMEVFDVWVCTKPLEVCSTCRDDKGAWIKRYLPELEDKLIIAPNKGLIRGSILLDDAIKTAWLAYAEWTPVVFPSVFNGPGSDWEGMDSWTWGDPVGQLLDLVNP